MLDEEIRLIAIFNSTNRDIGYNITIGGDGASGLVLSDEVKEKMRKAKEGMYFGEENPFFGKTHSDKTKQHLSQLASKKIGDLNPFFGKVHTEKALQKMRDNHYDKKRYLSDEQIAEVRAKYKPRIYTIAMLAREYGISETAIDQIVHYRRGYASEKPQS